MLDAVGRTLPQPSTETIDLVTVLHALADPVRLRLVRALAEQDGPVACSQAANVVEVTAATQSHHWRVLREAGVTTTVAEGRERLIQIRRDDLEGRFPGLLGAVLEAN